MDVYKMRTTAAIGLIMYFCSSANSVAQEMICAFDEGEQRGQRVFEFAPEQRVLDAVDEVVRVTNLRQNFEILAGNVANVCATYQNNRRMVYYSRRWLQSLQEAAGGDRWPMLTLMAHEVGHHLNGDTFLPDEDSLQREIDADYFAGGIVRRLGGSQSDARKLFDLIGEHRLAAAGATETHPPETARYEAVLAGWHDAGGGSSPQSQASQLSPSPLRSVAASDGRCRSVVIPATFRTVTNTVVVEEASERLEVVPATYKTVSQTVVVGQAYRQGDKVETEAQTVVVEAPGEQLQVIPATYKTISETVLVQEPYTRFELVGEEVREIAVPGQTRTVQRRVVDTPSSVRRVSVPAKTRTVQVQVVKERIGTGIPIPARTATIQRRVLDQPTSVRRIRIPGKTATIQQRVLATEASVEERC